MPCLGYVLSGLAADLIERYAGIVTLVILGIIGGNMLIEGIKSLKKEKPEDCECCGDTSQHLTVWTLILQAIATAIDAFAVGVSLRAEVCPSWPPRPSSAAPPSRSASWRSSSDAASARFWGTGPKSQAAVSSSLSASRPASCSSVWILGARLCRWANG